MTHPKHILARHGLDAKKSLGQNFLFDDNVLQKIVDAAQVAPGMAVLEIGPGLGHLTAKLLEAAEAVTAVELDSRFLPILQDQFNGYANFTLIHGDILAVDVAEIMERPFSVVANVPYYITGAILKHLLSAPRKPTNLVLTVQKEVADRLAAAPPNMSLLSATTQYYGTVEQIGTIKAGAFYPRPDVDSAIVRITMHNALPLDPAQEQRFMKLLKVGFSQKRKQLKNNLRQLGLNKQTLKTTFEQAKIDPTRRPQTLRVDEWLALFVSLAKQKS